MTPDAAGWISGARRVPSPNYAPRPAGGEVVLAVLHGISLPRGVFGGDDILRLFCNTLDFAADPSYESLRDARVSAHFLIRRNGALLQFVSCRDCAWHAGESQWRGRARCNDFSLGIELEGADDIAYDARQYDALAALLPALRRRYPLLAVAGHADIAPGRKTDPGAAFDWRRLFAGIGSDYDGRAAA